MHILKQCKTKKGRDEAGLFAVEGATFVSEIPAAWEIVRYIMSEGYPCDAAALVRFKARAPVEVLPTGRFAAYTDTVTPQGIAAVVRQKEYNLTEIIGQGVAFAPDMPGKTPRPFYLLCEALQDPGNVGALIRTAAAAGAAAVFLTPGSADPYNPKVLRAAAGAVLRIPVIADILLDTVLPCFNAHSVSLYAAHPRGDCLPYAVDMTRCFCLFIGNEARGLSEEALAAALPVGLPMAAYTESLNAATAGSILLYEAVRQRSVEVAEPHGRGAAGRG